MDLSTLLASYPIAKELIERAPQIKQWLEKKAKKDDPIVFMYLETQQSRAETRRNLLENSILSAMLANPDLNIDQVKERFLKTRDAAREIVRSVEGDYER
jgi:hypothetical protein